MYRVLKGYEGSLNKDNFDLYKEFQLTQTIEEETKEDKPTKTQADIELERALAQAEAIMNTARDAAEKIKQEAHAKGYQAGLEAGQSVGKEQAYKEYQGILETKADALQQSIVDYVSDMQRAKELVLEEYIDDLKSIALTIGEKIIQVSLKSSSDVVERMIISATERLKKTAWAKIYVGNSGRQIQASGDSRLLKELSKLSDNIKIILIEEEEPGTCIVELPDEIIDISVGTQLENIKEIINNARTQ